MLGGASGVWIGKNLVLTVAHGALDSKAEPANGTDFEFRIPTSSGFIQRRGKRFHVPKAFINEAKSKSANNLALGAMDIAVLELEFDLQHPGISPAIVSSSGPAKGSLATYVGYGVRGTTSSGQDHPKFGTGGWEKPLRALAFRGVLESEAFRGWRLDSIFRGDGKLELEGATSTGDSGGGCFVQVDSEWRLVGIIAYGDTGPNGKFWQKSSISGSRSGSTNVSKFFKGIMQGYQTGDWTVFEQTKIPE
jgi:hypothetical protein